MATIKNQFKYAECVGEKVLSNKTKDLIGKNLLIRTDSEGMVTGDDFTNIEFVEGSDFQVVGYQNEKLVSVPSSALDKSRGERGPKGLPGKDGLDGKNGSDGLKGVDGDKGERGDKGEKGDKGDKGDQGDKGERGDKGDTGDRGDKGDVGDKGPIGDKGPAGGAQGDKGDKGDPGLTKVVLKQSKDKTTFQYLRFAGSARLRNSITGVGEETYVVESYTKKIRFFQCTFDTSAGSVLNDLEGIDELYFDDCTFYGGSSNIIQMKSKDCLNTLSFKDCVFENGSGLIVAGLGTDVTINRFIFKDNDLSDWSGYKFEEPYVFQPSVKSYVVTNNVGFATKISRIVTINSGARNTGFVTLTLNELPFSFIDNTDMALLSARVVPVSPPGNSTVGNGWYLSKHTHWASKNIPAKFMVNSVVSPTTDWSFVVEVSCEYKN